MARVTVRRRGGVALAKRARDLPDHILREAQRILQDGMQEILDEALVLVPEDLGALKASGKIESMEDHDSIILAISFGDAAAPYALYVHEGTQAPRKPPPKANLIAWVHRHFAVDSEAEAERIAYFIGQKIAREGSQPVKFLEIPFRKMLPKITARMRAIGAGKNAIIR